MLSTGVVPHEDPALSSGWYYPPWHLYYFSRKTLTVLLHESGFAVDSYWEDHPDLQANNVMVILARPTAERGGLRYRAEPRP